MHININIKQISIFFTFGTFLFLSLPAFAAKFYWRTNITNANADFMTINNWETTPGSGVTLGRSPGFNDTVYFVGNPITTIIKTVSASATCKDIVYNVSGQKITFNGTYFINGSIASNGYLYISANVTFQSPEASSIDMLGGSSDHTSPRFTGGALTFKASGGSYTLLNDLITTSTIYLFEGDFTTNEKKLQFYALLINNNLNRPLQNKTIDFSNSTIQIQYRFNIYSSTLTNLITSTADFIYTGSGFNNIHAFEDEYNYITAKDMTYTIGSITTSTPIFNVRSGNKGMKFNVGKFICNTSSLNFIQSFGDQNIWSITDSLILNKNCLITNKQSWLTLKINAISYPPPPCGTQIIFSNEDPKGSDFTIESISQTLIINDIGFTGVTFGGYGFSIPESNDLGNNKGNYIRTAPLSGKKYYWIGRSTVKNSWFNTENWSLTSNGVSNGICIPTAMDTVVFDAGSFTAAEQMVAVDSSSASCGAMIWETSAGNQGNLSGNTISINGSADFTGAKNISNTLYFIGSNNHTITSGSVATYPEKIYFQCSGTYTLLDDFTAPSAALYLYSGKFVSNGNTIYLSRFTSSPVPAAAIRELDFSNSRIFLTYSGNDNTWDLSPGEPILTTHFTNSTIDLTGPNAKFNTGYYFNIPGTIQYNDIIFSADSGTVLFTSATPSPVNPTPAIRTIINNLTFKANATLQGGATVNNFYYTNGYTYAASLLGSTNCIFYIQGNLINLPSANSCGKAFFKHNNIDLKISLIKTNGPFTTQNLIAQNINASAGNTLVITDGINMGGNQNVQAAGSPETYYWVGGSGNWSDGTHWSVGDPNSSYPAANNPQKCIPTFADSVVFNGNSFFASKQTVTIDVVTYFFAMLWTTDAGNWNPVLTGSQPMNCYRSFTLAPGLSMPNYSGTLFMLGISSDPFVNFIQTKGVLFPKMNITFNGERFDLLDDVSSASDILIHAISYFHSNGKNITANNFKAGNFSKASINIANSTLNLSGNFQLQGAKAITNNATVIAGGDVTESNSWKYNQTLYFNQIISGGTKVGSSNNDTGYFFKFIANKIVLNNPANTLLQGEIEVDTLVYSHPSTFNEIKAGCTVYVKDTLIHRGGTPCNTFNLKSTNTTTPATLRSGKCNIRFDFADIDAINADVSNGCTSSNYLAFGGSVIRSNNWNFTPFSMGVALGPDTSISCQNTPFTQTTDGFGDIKKSYLWNTGETSSSIQVSTPGTYSVIATYTPGCEFTSTRKINIIDTTAPGVICLSDQSFYANSANCMYENKGKSLDPTIDLLDCPLNPGINGVWYTLSGATVASSTPTSEGNFTLDGISLNQGTTLINCFAKDNPFPTSNIGSCSFSVTVYPTTAPIITIGFQK